MSRSIQSRASRALRLASPAVATAAALLAAHAALASYTQTNLVSDGFVPAAHTDPNLKNPWGASSDPSGGPFWISNQVTGTATVYNSAGEPFPTGSPLVVTIPQSSTPPNGPTGQVFNTTSSFNLTTDGKSGPGLFFFANLDGSISGWNPSGTTTQATKVVTPAAGAAQVYTGVTIATNSGGDFLLAANDAAGTVDVYDTSFKKVSLVGNFSDPSVPANLHPFNVRTIGDRVYVTYAVPGPAADEEKPGSGAVSVFDTNGNLVKSLAQGGVLSSPWGIVQAPANFGEFSNALLVGNFSDEAGVINAFDANTGSFLGTVRDAANKPINNPDLWALIVGNGGLGGDANTLFLTAGVGDETHGLFASIAPGGAQAIPLPPAGFTAPLAAAVGWLAMRMKRARG